MIQSHVVICYLLLGHTTYIFNNIFNNFSSISQTDWYYRPFLKTTFTSQSMYNNSDKDHCKNFGMSDDIAVGCCSGG